MLSLSIIALGLTTIGAYATPLVRAVNDLKVSLSTPTDKVASASELRVVATVRNVGDEDLKVLKFGTVLDDSLRAPSFIIRKGDEDVPFTGVAKFSILTNHLSEDDWVVIPAGKAVTAEHNVSTAYDFSTTGPGTFTFDSVPGFRVVGLDGTVKTGVTDTRPVSITFTDDVSKRELDLEKRSRVLCEDSSQAEFLDNSLREAKALIFLAELYIVQRGVNDPVYKDYFGSNTAKSVLDNFDIILKEKSPSKLLSCGDPKGQCTNGMGSYTLDNSVVYFCPVFFTASYPSSKLCHGGTVDEKLVSGGFVISQLAYVFMGAKGIKGRCPDSRDLSNDDKLRNGANYECFALRAYQNSRCG